MITYYMKFYAEEAMLGENLALSAYIIEEEKFKVNHLKLQLRILENEQIKYKVRIQNKYRTQYID